MPYKGTVIEAVFVLVQPSGTSLIITSLYNLLTIKAGIFNGRYSDYGK
jgi:hypothetical protein